MSSQGGAGVRGSCQWEQGDEDATAGHVGGWYSEGFAWKVFSLSRATALSTLDDAPCVSFSAMQHLGVFPAPPRSLWRTADEGVAVAETRGAVLSISSVLPGMIPSPKQCQPIIRRSVRFD